MYLNRADAAFSCKICWFVMYVIYAVYMFAKTYIVSHPVSLIEVQSGAFGISLPPVELWMSSKHEE